MKAYDCREASESANSVKFILIILQKMGVRIHVPGQDVCWGAPSGCPHCRRCVGPPRTGLDRTRSPPNHARAQRGQPEEK